MCTSLYVNCVSMEFSRQEYWSRLPFPSTGDFPDPGIEPGSPTLQVDSLPSELPGKPKNVYIYHYSHFMDEETEAQRGGVITPAGGLGFSPKKVGSRGCLFIIVSSYTQRSQYLTSPRRL